MAKDKKFDPAVYVNVNELTAWGSKMRSINEEAINCLESFLSSVNSLEGSWEGDSFNAFIDDIDVFIKAAIATHHMMSDVESFLYSVVETMEKQ